LLIGSVASCIVVIYVVNDFKTVAAGEFRALARRELPLGSSEQEVVAFLQRVEASPPEEAAAHIGVRSEVAATFERGAGCYSGCVRAHVEPTALVLFARLDNTRGCVPLCDAGGVFAWFILDTEHRLQEIVTEDFRACL